jgi:hypothetical protein
VIGTSVWRQGPGDAITATPCPGAAAGNSWKLRTRRVSSGPSGKPTLPENGLVVTVTPQSTDITFDVTITHGANGMPEKFSFHSAQLPFGTPQRFLGGRVYVARTPSPLQLTSSIEEEDFPSMARSGDDVWLAYVRFVHGDRSLQLTGSIKEPPPAWVTNNDFAFLARPTGMDQVFAMHYSVSSRTWTGPFPITAASEDVVRTAVAVDGQNRAWVFYSTQRTGNFDLYAKSITSAGTVSSELRLTTLPGTDLNPVATTDASGRVWVAWQAFRNGNLEILAAVQQGDAFTPERIVSTSAKSDWDPAIAASANGEVAISWDTYDKGDYDVNVRRVSVNPLVPGVVLAAVQPVAASLQFEARSSIAYDPQNRLWIAYETAPQRWGKDYGALDTAGVGLYMNHNIAVRCLDGAAQFATSDPVIQTLPGPPNAQLFTTKPLKAAGSLPDESLADNRTPGGEPSVPPLPNNSVPRLAIDSDGTVYLAFRTKAGGSLSTDSTTGSSVGSIWIEQMVYFDGARWNGPSVIAQSDGLLDSRPVIVPLEGGHLLIAQATDHRLSPPPGSTLAKDTVNFDIYAAELTVQRNQQAAQLTPSPAVVGPASQDELDEAAQATTMSNYRAQVAGQSYQVLRGDFHRHTELSFDGGQDGSLADAYRYMIDAGPLGWGGCCDHDNGGSREYSWWILQKYTEAYLLGGRYTPMFNYERSVAYPEGHRNAVFARRGVRPLPRLPISGQPAPPGGAPDTNLFYKYLRFFGGLDAAHTSATDQGTDWRNNDPQVETSVEIYQGSRQSYEMADGPRTNSKDDSIAGFENLGYVSNALAKGYQLGFESSSDHRSSHLSYANVWVSDTSRQGVLDALSKRRVYAATDLILADVRIGTHLMGEVFTMTGPPTLSVNLQGTNAFAEVKVVKDGAIVYSYPTNGLKAITFSWQDTNVQPGKQSYYYVRGLQQGLPQADGSTDPGQVVWTSPMWVTVQ